MVAWCGNAWTTACRTADIAFTLGLGKSSAVQPQSLGSSKQLRHQPLLHSKPGDCPPKFGAVHPEFQDCGGYKNNKIRMSACDGFSASRCFYLLLFAIRIVRVLIFCHVLGLFEARKQYEEFFAEESWNDFWNMILALKITQKRS